MLVPSPHQHPLQAHKIAFWILEYEFLLTCFLTTYSHIVKQNRSENCMFQNLKIKFSGLWGMFMRTWDYHAIPIEPDFAPLEQIFDQKIMIFFEKMIFLDV